MQRREFITLVGGTAAVWPLVAHAQEQRVRLIGILSSLEEAENKSASNRCCSSYRDWASKAFAAAMFAPIQYYQ